jgi:hypothetical protein
MVCMVFGVLFGFRHSDFRSSDHFPSFLHAISFLHSNKFHFLPFLRAIVAEQVGQYHLPLGGAVMPTHG